MIFDENESADAARKGLIVPSYPTLVKMEKFLDSVAMDQMNAKRLVGLFFVELSKGTKVSEKLNKCTVESVCGAIMACAQYGLEPGIAGMAYLIPRWNEVKKKYDMSVMIGYRGMIEMAYRTNMISTIRAYMVYEKDEFTMKMGSDCMIDHKRSTGQRGERLGAYAIVTMKDGSQHFDFMDTTEIERIKNEYGNVQKTKDGVEYGPWISDYDAMAQKTVIRKVLKYAPTSVRLNAGISFDEAYDYDGQDLAKVGKVAMIQAGVEKVEQMALPRASQADSLADKLSGKTYTMEGDNGAPF